MDAAKARAHVPSEDVLFEYDSRDAIIYALGVGCKTSSDVRYLYEGAEGFIPLPTFVVAPGLLANLITDWPGVEFDLPRVLHGEQYIEVFSPLPSNAKLRSETRVVDILDKGSGALVLTEITTYDANTGAKLSFQQFGTFQVGSGNFGGSRSSQYERKGSQIPARPADKVFAEQTLPDQAALYRLGSGDLNPLHIDSEFAKMSGFKQPILHGLCSLGFAVRQVIKHYASNDASMFKACKARFASPVIPGQTLETFMWDEGDRIVFEVKVKETGKVVISNAYVVLHGRNSKGSSESAKTPSGGLLSSMIFQSIKAELANNQDNVKKIKAVILYEILKNGKTAGKWTLDLQTPPGAVYEGEPRSGVKPNVTVLIEDDVFAAIASGELDSTKAFMSGKVKAKGNIMLLQKLAAILKAVNSKAKM